MKKYGIITMIALLVLAAMSMAYAADVTKVDQATQDYRLRIGAKAERGASNALFGWTEVPKRVVDLTQETKNPIWGLLAGTCQGVAKGFARTASGLSDIATCGIKNDEKPLVNPDMDTASKAKTQDAK